MLILKEKTYWIELEIEKKDQPFVLFSTEDKGTMWNIENTNSIPIFYHILDYSIKDKQKESVVELDEEKHNLIDVKEIGCFTKFSDLFNELSKLIPKRTPQYFKEKFLKLCLNELKHQKDLFKIYNLRLSLLNHEINAQELVDLEFKHKISAKLQIWLMKILYNRINN